MLPDGVYDAFVVDVTVEAAAEPDQRVTHLELTITSGELKGEIVPLSAHGLDREEHDLLGMPATITVVAGAPSVTIDG